MSNETRQLVDGVGTYVLVVAQPNILHADLDAFYASVEQRDHPHLRGQAIVVGGGIVLSASYEARTFGIYTPMGLDKARQLCPGLIMVEARFSSYSEASKAVFKIFENTTPLVEALSIDEAFLDVHGLELMSGTSTEIAVKLRAQVRKEVGLPITVGVARTKHLAKVASQVAKPDGLLVVPLGEELAFLHPLPVERIWGVGPATARKLHAGGITTVADIARMPEEAVVKMLGRAAGRHLHALANDRDPRPVLRGVRRRSIGSQHATGLSRLKLEALDATLMSLVDRVTRRMRAARRVGRTVVLRMRFGDYTRGTRSHTLAWPTCETQTILAAERALLAAALPLIERDGLTMIGVSVSNLENADAIQLRLPFERRSNAAIDSVLDRLRDRFGSNAVVRAALLGREEREAMPLLPD